MDLQRIKEEAAARVETATKGKKGVKKALGGVYFETSNSMLSIPTEVKIDILKALPADIIKGKSADVLESIYDVVPMVTSWLTALGKGKEAKVFARLLEEHNFSVFKDVPAKTIKKLGGDLGFKLGEAYSAKLVMTETPNPFALYGIYDNKGKLESIQVEGGSSETSVKEMESLGVDFSKLDANGKPTKKTIQNYVAFYNQNENKLPKDKKELRKLLNLIEENMDVLTSGATKKRKDKRVGGWKDMRANATYEVIDLINSKL